MNARRRIAHITATLTLAACAGCANPWARNYRPAAPALAPGPRVNDAPPVLLSKPAVVIDMADPPPGMVELGACRFEADAHAGPAGLSRLAEDVGAREVWWAVESLGGTTRTSTARMPVYHHGRVGGALTAADGSTRSVDLTTTTARWEDVTVASTRTRYWHVARLFGIVRADDVRSSQP